jgi:hypothetical protein
MTRWTDSDALRARDARFVGGPNDGLFIPVSDGTKGLRYPDVVSYMDDYVFDRETWTFRVKPVAERTPWTAADEERAKELRGRIGIGELTDSDRRELRQLRRREAAEAARLRRSL